MIRRLGAALVLALAAWLTAVAVWIAVPPKPRFAEADAAIVLGAPLHDGRPSPAFQARIEHGIALVKLGRARILILTGGPTRGSAQAEADAARHIAVAAGIAPSRVLVENSSVTTAQNLEGAASLMRANGLHSALIVTDSVHLRRAMWLARRAGITASAERVPEGHYGGIGGLAREMAAWHRDALRCAFH